MSVCMCTHIYTHALACLSAWKVTCVWNSDQMEAGLVQGQQVQDWPTVCQHKALVDEAKDLCQAVSQLSPDTLIGPNGIIAQIHGVI